MPTLESTPADLNQEPVGLPDFSSEAYKDAYSRINAIVIEGEQEAHDNYIAIGT
ncbi:MAG: long-chain fatty aldehyde decarbonylase, partial [Cyanobium sp.]